MKPMIPLHKHSNGFSIDSLIHRECANKPCDNIPCGSSSENVAMTLSPSLSDVSAIAGRIPPLHPALPPHVRNLLLTADQNHPPSATDLLSLHRSAAWAFQNSSLPSISTLSRLVPSSSSVVPLQPTLPALWPPPRDPLTLTGHWPIARTVPGILGYPFGK